MKPGPAHWITLSNIGQPDGTVNIYDSLNLTPKQDVVHTIAKYLHTPQKQITMNIMNVVKQTNGYDCGVYAIVFATSLANGIDPTKLQYKTLRSHLRNCIKEGYLSQFPSSDIPRKTTILKAKKVDVFCICRQPIDKSERTMLACDKCNEWFHLDCLKMEKVPRKRKWYCEKCSQDV